ncbi:MAG: tRNA 2-thiouridine(34) synthase MnmA [Chloroflexi bacterium RBG_13_51_36]|nr:MAG: tRNA 2-thiouridine(34) synthase MnmA [Chloroflexi bacterium RBG_13_51_36]
MTKRKVAVALSGGVDSAAAALLLTRAAYEVIGIHMRLRDSPSFDDHAHRAADICRILGIPYHQLDLQKEFESCVVDYFCREYRHGRTPNPCVACNHYVKFGLLLDKALSLGADYLATGHYAKVEHSRHGHRLLKAADTRRDQSYFLYTLTQEKLGRVLFPLGEHNKDEVKQMAMQAGLPTATKSSQDICFISRKNYGAFLSQRFPTLPGEVVDTRGRKLGQHRGIAFYTVGQRHGLGLASGKPLYVIRIEPESNRIVLGHEEELYSRKLTAHNLNWISGKIPRESITARAKIRYKSKETEATLSFRNDSVDVHFAQPQKAVTPGQAIVFYNVDEVLGGGIIDSVERET